MTQSPARSISRFSASARRARVHAPPARPRAWFLQEFGLEWKITGIATQNHGMAIDPNGLPVQDPAPFRSRISTAITTVLPAPPTPISSASAERTCCSKRACSTSAANLPRPTSARRCRPACTW